MDTHHQVVGCVAHEKAGHSVVFPPTTRKGSSNSLQCEERDLLDSIWSENGNTRLHTILCTQFFSYHFPGNVAVIAPFTQWAKAQQWEFPDLAVRLGKWLDLHGLRVEQQGSPAPIGDVGTVADDSSMDSDGSECSPPAVGGLKHPPPGRGHPAQGHKSPHESLPGRGAYSQIPLEGMLPPLLLQAGGIWIHITKRWDAWCRRRLAIRLSSPQQQGRVAAIPWDARSGISWTVFGRRMGIPASTLFSALSFLVPFPRQCVGDCSPHTVGQSPAMGVFGLGSTLGRMDGSLRSEG
jgi:hypothetical protein